MDEYISHSSYHDIEVFRKHFFEGLRAENYGQLCNDEDPNLFDRTQRIKKTSIQVAKFLKTRKEKITKEL